MGKYRISARLQLNTSTPIKQGFQVVSALCQLEFTPSSSKHIFHNSASICTTFASIQVLCAFLFTTNRNSSFCHMSGTRRASTRRVASNVKVKQEEGGTEDELSVPQETVEKVQSYAFRPTGKRKDYKPEGTSEGRCSHTDASQRYSSTSETRLSLVMIVPFPSFQALAQMKTCC